MICCAADISCGRKSGLGTIIFVSFACLYTVAGSRLLRYAFLRFMRFVPFVRYRRVLVRTLKFGCLLFTAYHSVVPPVLAILAVRGGSIFFAAISLCRYQFLAVSLLAIFVVVRIRAYH